MLDDRGVARLVGGFSHSILLDTKPYPIPHPSPFVGRIVGPLTIEPGAGKRRKASSLEREMLQKKVGHQGPRTVFG